MESKKLPLVLHLLLLIGIFSLSAYNSNAQSGTYDVYDSSVVSPKKMAQQNEFWNNTYSFPAKPRNQWEIGISGGMFSVSGDVPSQNPTPGGAIHIRKALGYVFSIRAQYTYGIAKGLAWNESYNFAKNPAWSAYSAPVLRSSPGGQAIFASSIAGRPTEGVFYNYRSKVQDLSLQGILTFNNIRFHKQKSGIVIYGGVGFGMTAYHTMVNALDASGQPYTSLFSSIPLSAQTHSNRKNVISTLKDQMDDTYETEAQAPGRRRGTLGSNTLRPSGHFIGGVAFKLSKRINLAFEEKYTVVKDDFLDGQIWQEYTVGDAALTPEFDSYNFASIGLNFNLGSKSVEPLWWLNPLDYVYSELNNPRHMKLPKPTFDDADNDGVLDQLDREPNTPAGCPVDTHGVSRDTDGDGVPDCNDKELITPTYCQPVDADGVGNCPLPDCCKNQPTITGPEGCPIGDLPSISFKGNTSTLTADAKAMLATVASKLKTNAQCNIIITGYPAASKASQALCSKRTQAIKQYLMEKEGVSADRISTNCEIGGGDANTIDIKTTK
ncbi:MAG: OmpA family protein [Chitinophagaceae bacterium]|nr:OmpA family protein [Chitinophagaceae bacterium]MDB5221408.1 OmpA family protein [Chitinophagaceae bacterium]